MEIDILNTCRCEVVGQDDGENTCWVHHDCTDGSCTHTDGDDYEIEDELEEGVEYDN